MGKKWEKNGVMWEVGVMTGIWWLKEIVEEAGRRGIKVGVVIQPLMECMSEGQQGKMRACIGEEWGAGEKSRLLKCRK